MKKYIALLLLAFACSGCYIDESHHGYNSYPSKYTAVYYRKPCANPGLPSKLYDLETARFWSNSNNLIGSSRSYHEPRCHTRYRVIKETHCHY